MGTYLSGIFKHPIPLHDLAEAAQYLADKFQTSVEYGIIQRIGHKYTCEGKIGEGDDIKLIQRFSIDEPEIYFEISKVSEPSFNYNTVHPHIIYSIASADPKWYRCTELVFEPEECAELSPFRKTIQSEAKFWDATEVLYIPDAGLSHEADFVNDDIYWMEWDQLLEKIITTVGNYTVDVSDVIRKKYDKYPTQGILLLYDDFSFIPPYEEDNLH